MPYVHKLNVYDDPPHKKVVYCTVCGQDIDLAGECPGEYKMTKKEQKATDKSFERDFRRIFEKRA